MFFLPLTRVHRFLGWQVPWACSVSNPGLSPGREGEAEGPGKPKGRGKERTRKGRTQEWGWEKFHRNNFTFTIPGIPTGPCEVWLGGCGILEFTPYTADNYRNMTVFCPKHQRLAPGRFQKEQEISRTQTWGLGVASWLPSPSAKRNPHTSWQYWCESQWGSVNI